MSREVVAGIRADGARWKRLIIAALRYRTVAAIRLHTRQSRPVILAMYRRLRAAMSHDVPEVLSGTVEADETYIGPQWRNLPWSVRKRGTKRGRGTSKQAVFGILERDRGVVLAFLVPDVKKRTLLPIIVRHVEKGSLICSDAYQLYQETVHAGYRHAFVDHKKHEYARGEVHSNTMEGFWGLLKRRLKTTGGIRVDRLHLYVAEEVWRYNNRKLSEAGKAERLLGLLRQVGG
jgi:transposase-like protein